MRIRAKNDIYKKIIFLDKSTFLVYKKPINFMNLFAGSGYLFKKRFWELN